MKKNCGFTLIEVLIAVAILGIIAAIAIPSYSQYAMKARRAEAVTSLTEIAGEQYRYFSENNSYATKLTDLGYSTDNLTTENGNYTVAVSASSTSTYTVTATAKSAQAGDTSCATLSINSVGVKTVTPSATAVEDCW